MVGVFRNEPHGWGELRHQLFKVNVEIDWFERHVRCIEYEWETAPESEADEETEESDEDS